MSASPFRYQLKIELSKNAYNALRSELKHIKVAHPDLPPFVKVSDGVVILGETPEETLKFRPIAYAALIKLGYSTEVVNDTVKRTQPTPLAPDSAAAVNAPLPPVASANNAGWNVAGSQAAAAAVNAPLPPVASANDAGWNIAGSRAAAQHLPNAVYEKMHANMSRAAARRAAMVGGGKRRFTRRVRKSKQSKKSKQSRKAVQSSRSRSRRA